MDISELSKSPPHETKMRLISRRVSDIKWKNGDTSPSAEHQSEAGVTSTIEVDDPEVPTAPPTQETTNVRSMQSVISTETDKRPVQNEDSEVLDAARGSKWQPSAEDLTPPLDTAGPSEALSNKKSMESIRSTSSATKRQREDEEDVNPRETKRPSPPPAKDTKPQPEVPEAKVAGSSSQTTTSQPNSTAPVSTTGTPKFVSSSLPKAK
jgi:Ran-binding protein 3